MGYFPNEKDAMHDLKQAKFALNSGDAERSRNEAKKALLKAQGRKLRHIQGYALHRIGMAESSLGLPVHGIELMLDAESILKKTQDKLGLGIVQRDVGLAVGEHVNDHSEAKSWYNEAISNHSSMRSARLTPRRVELELSTTKSFLPRLRLLRNRYDDVALDSLKNLVESIRIQRGRTKPSYEFDAIDWITRYEDDPLVIARHLPRAAFLSMQLGNPTAILSLSTRPAIRGLSNLLEKP